MQSILVFGSEGQLGSELVKIYPDAIAASRRGQAGKAIDVTSSLQVEDLILKERPDIVINASALTDVEKCQEERILAYRTNALAVSHMVRAASVVGSKFVHISTDYVFDGKDGDYKEESTPAPINYYGLSKLIGDAFAQSYDDSLIIRTSGVFGVKKNFPLFALEQLRSGKKLNVIDGTYSPIHASILAKAVEKAIITGHTGTLNIAGDAITRKDLALGICDRMSLDSSGISVVDSAGMKWKAMRPDNSSLNTDRARKLLGFDFHSLDVNLDRLVDLADGGD